MPISSFINRLTALAPLSEAAQTFLTQILTRQRLPKNTVILAVGEVCNHLYFLESGLARAFYQDGPDEITSWIVGETDFMYSVYSYLNQKPSLETIELLEDTVLISATRTDLDGFYARFPEGNLFRSLLTEHYLLQYDQRLRGLQMLSAEERVKRYAREHPNLFSRIPLKHLATYLNMNASTMSRIRAKKM